VKSHELFLIFKFVFQESYTLELEHPYFNSIPIFCLTKLWLAYCCWLLLRGGVVQCDSCTAAILWSIVRSSLLLQRLNYESSTAWNYRWKFRNYLQTPSIWEPTQANHDERFLIISLCQEGCLSECIPHVSSSDTVGCNTNSICRCKFCSSISKSSEYENASVSLQGN
jgi:hypothetical protein